MNLRHAAMLAVPQGADEGDDVEAELVLGQGQAAFALGPVGAEMAVTGAVMAAADGQVQAGAAGEGNEGAVVGVVQPHALTAGGAVLPLGREILEDSGLGSARRLGHRIALLGWTQSLPKSGRQHPAEFAGVVFFCWF
jgi:hypothetical protein